jgi:hypothetical protein
MSVGDVMAILGCEVASCSTVNREVDDFYVTPSNVTRCLLELEEFDSNIWECAVGRGDMAEVLTSAGYNVVGSDVVDRGFDGVVLEDFLECSTPFDGDIVTNPPYKYSTDFVLKALELSKRKVAMLFKIQFCEGIDRYNRLFSKFPPYCIYVFPRRVGCLKNGETSHSRSAICYAWFVWDKEYTGETLFRWIDNV